MTRNTGILRMENAYEKWYTEAMNSTVKTEQERVALLEKEVILISLLPICAAVLDAYGVTANKKFLRSMTN